MGPTRDIDEGQESGGAQRAAVQPASEHTYLARARMQALGQIQQAPTIDISCAGEHHSQACHEETRTRPGPSLRFMVTGHAELNEPLFEVPIEGGGEVSVQRGIRRILFQHAQTRTDGLGQQSKRFKVAALTMAKARKGLLAHTCTQCPFGI